MNKQVLCAVVVLLGFGFLVATSVLLAPLPLPPAPITKSGRHVPLSPRALAVANARRKLAERDAWLSSAHSEASAFIDLELAGSPAWYLFTPVFGCDGTFEKYPTSAARHDGGKWLCGLQEEAAAVARDGADAHDACIVYSFGSNNDFTLEERVHVIAPHCEVHTFDPTAFAPQPDSLAATFVHFHDDFGLGGALEGPTAHRPFAVSTLQSIMAAAGHTQLTVLKVDIEGSEWGFINNTDWKNARIGQVLVELHPQYGPRTAGAFLSYSQRLEAGGFFLASLEPVTLSNFGQVEVVFLHRDWVPGKGWVTPQAPNG